jgi:cyclic pyranopterin monophosphate synthase
MPASGGARRRAPGKRGPRERPASSERGGPAVPRLSHVDRTGVVRMVDVSAKPVTAREAVARGRITMSRDAVRQVRERRVAKGDPLQAARLAGVMAAKRTADLIPLCHSLPLTHVDLALEEAADGYVIEARVRTDARTGVEMEALCAVSVAALTIYDMVKAVDKAMVIGEIQLMRKTGGRSGDYRA